MSGRRSPAVSDTAILVAIDLVLGHIDPDRVGRHPQTNSAAVTAARIVRAVSHPKVTMLRGEEISIAAERPFEVYGDGERIGPLPATFRVIPRALSVVAPAR